MRFTVKVTGDVSVEAEASDMGIDLDNPNEILDVSSDVELDDVQVTGTVTLTARATVTDIEVMAADLQEFDADQALSERISPYGGCDTSDASFEVTDGPDGYEDVLQAVGYDQDVAVEVFAILDRAGYSN